MYGEPRLEEVLMVTKSLGDFIVNQSEVTPRENPAELSRFELEVGSS